MTKINVKSVCAVLLAMAGIITLSGTNVLKLHAQDSDVCTSSILRGGYGSGTTGLINNSSNPNDITLPTFVPFTEAVHFVFNGRGSVSGTSTADFGGTSFPVTFQGTYLVKPNCTGNMTINAGDNGIIHRDLVIVDGGKEVEFVDTDPGFAIAGSMKKQRAE